MFRYILSFDVGTVNLAYCLVRTNTEKNFEILKWDIIDFSYHPLLCKFIKNVRAVCNEKSKYYDNINNETIGYCQNHAKIMKKDDIISFKKLKMLSKNGDMVDNFNKKTDRLLKKLNELYDDITKIYFFDNGDSIGICNNIEVYIENQPALKIPEMKSISIIIYTFFKIKRDGTNIINIINTVDFISASNKTKSNFMNLFLKELNITKIIANDNNISYVIRNDKNKYITTYNIKVNKNKNVDENKKNIFFSKLIEDKINFKIGDYDDRKDIIVLIVKIILDKLLKTKFNIISISNFELHKKKDDDLADAFIYCIFVLLKKNKITDYF
jgi:hypothetical protein